MTRYFVLISIIVTAILSILFYTISSRHSIAALPTEKEEIRHLRLGHNMPVDSAMHEAAVLYAKTVAEKSGGHLVIDIYPDQQLGDDHKMAEMARRDMLDIALIPTAKMSVALPAMQYVDLPFYFPSREDTYEMLDGEPGQMLLDKLRQIGLVGVTFWENGFKHFTANTPLYTPKDFQGKKFRIMKSRLIQSQFEVLGATTVPIDFHATRQALADGVVDGQENPLIAIKSMGIDKVQKYLTLSSHAYMGYVFCISEKTYRSLPSKFQHLLYDTARELTPYEREQTHKREAQLLTEMEKNGMIVHTLDAKERAAMKKATAPLLPSYEGIIGADIISKTEELMNSKYGPSPESGKQIIIGLNADLSTNSKVAGLAIKRGAILAIEEINAKGGVLGKPLYLVAKDHRGIASKGADNVRMLAARKDVVAIIGGVQSGVETESIREAQKASIPYLIPWAAAAELTGSPISHNVIFRISANDRDAIAFLGEYILRHYRSPSIIYENSVWGRGAYKRMQELCKTRNRPLLASITFNIGQQNFDNAADEIKRSHADVVLLVANSNEAAYIVNTLDRHKLNLPIVSHWGITSNRFFEETKEALQRTNLLFLQTFSFQNSQTVEGKRLEKCYMSHYAIASPEAIQAPAGVAQSHDLVHLVAQAIEHAGSTDRNVVQKALENLPPYGGAVRFYNPPFTPLRHDGLMREDYHLARFRQDGTIVPVQP